MINNADNGKTKYNSMTITISDLLKKTLIMKNFELGFNHKDTIVLLHAKIIYKWIIRT